MVCPNCRSILADADGSTVTARRRVAVGHDMTLEGGGSFTFTPRQPAQPVKVAALRRVAFRCDRCRTVAVFDPADVQAETAAARVGGSGRAVKGTAIDA